MHKMYVWSSWDARTKVVETVPNTQDMPCTAIGMPRKVRLTDIRVVLWCLSPKEKSSNVMTHRLALLLSDLEESFFFEAVLEAGGAFSEVEFDSDSVVFAREEPRVVDELMILLKRSRGKEDTKGAHLIFFHEHFLDVIFAGAEKLRLCDFLYLALETLS